LCVWRERRAGGSPAVRCGVVVVGWFVCGLGGSLGWAIVARVARILWREAVGLRLCCHSFGGGVAAGGVGLGLVDCAAAQGLGVGVGAEGLDCDWRWGPEVGWMPSWRFLWEGGVSGQASGRRRGGTYEAAWVADGGVRRRLGVFCRGSGRVRLGGAPPGGTGTSALCVQARLLKFVRCGVEGLGGSVAPAVWVSGRAVYCPL